MFLVAVGGVVAVVERELLGAGLAVAVRSEKRYPTPAGGGGLQHMTSGQGQTGRVQYDRNFALNRQYFHIKIGVRVNKMPKCFMHHIWWAPKETRI